MLACLSAALSGCSLPSVSLSTPQPIKVNIDMKLDVYQHGQAVAEKKAPAAPDTPQDAQNRRRLRLGEIQPLKNSRLVGEDHLGLLAIRSDAPGEYGDYVRGLVADENKDRTVLMQQMALTQKVSMADVQKQQALLAQHSAFNGEWIEILKPDGAYVWTQKGIETGVKN